MIYIRQKYSSIEQDAGQSPLVVDYRGAQTAPITRHLGIQSSSPFPLTLVLLGGGGVHETLPYHNRRIYKKNLLDTIPLKPQYILKTL